MTLQAKILVVLISVILPIFAVMTVVENQVAKPILLEELRQFGATAGRTLAVQISSEDLFLQDKSASLIESQIQEMMYLQPAIVRVDVARWDRVARTSTLVASNVEEDPASVQIPFVESTTSDLKTDDQGGLLWEVLVPIRASKNRILGTVRVLISTKLVGVMMARFSRITLGGAVVSVILLVVGLTVALRKTIENDRLLRQTQLEKLQLSQELQDAQQRLMTSEKLSVMGQLTANFAHEIGTPLNAMGGHLQLLQEDLRKKASSKPSPDVGDRSLERIEIIRSQLQKIADVVTSFLHSTTKPSLQRQLVDINQLVQKTVALVQPRLSALGIELELKLEAHLKPLRAVPLDLEQVLLNLVNNSIDSLCSKGEVDPKCKRVLTLSTRSEGTTSPRRAVVEVHDTGMGVKEDDLLKIWKPFFTTKRPGEGTGLGLNISERLVQKHGGSLTMESREGHWARVRVELPMVMPVVEATEAGAAPREEGVL